MAEHCIEGVVSGLEISDGTISEEEMFTILELFQESIKSQVSHLKRREELAENLYQFHRGNRHRVYIIPKPNSSMVLQDSLCSI